MGVREKKLQRERGKLGEKVSKTETERERVVQRI